MFQFLLITSQPVKQEPKELVFSTIRTSPEVIDLTDSPSAVTVGTVKQEPVLVDAAALSWKGKDKAVDIIDLTMDSDEE